MKRSASTSSSFDKSKPSDEEFQQPSICTDNVKMTSEQDLQEYSKIKDGGNEVVAPTLKVGNAPVFYPTETEFQDPLAYLEQIYDEAEKFGICKIVPPNSWRPPFSIDPDQLQFVPRVQPLCLLEAKQRLWLTFHCKVAQFWSMYALQIKYPLEIRGQQIDISEFNYILVDEIKAVGTLEEMNMDGWKNVATKLEFPKFDLEAAAIELMELYQTLIYPMEKFASEVSLKVKEHGKLHEHTCNKGVPKKRRMMAGFRRNNSKKAMKTRSNVNIAVADFNFDVLNTARVDLSCCRKCGVDINLESRKTILCVSCNANFHENCMEPPPAHSSHLFPSRQTFKCTGCTAFKLYNDPLLSFGFHDYHKKFSLCDFGDYADTYKKMYFGVEDTTKVGEREIEEEFWKLVLIPDRPVTVFYGADLHSRDIGSGFPVVSNNKEDSEPSSGYRSEVTSEYDDFKKYADSPWNLNNFPKLYASILRHIGSNVSGMTQPWIYIGMIFSAFCWHVEDHWTPSINFLHFGETKTWYGIPGSAAEKVDIRIKEYVPSLFHLQPDLMHNLNTMIHPNVLVEAGVPVSRIDQHAGEFVITFPRAYHCGFNQGFNLAEAVNFAANRWLNFGFDCIQHYISIKRNHVFSHEELLVTLCSVSETLSFKDAKEAYVQLKLSLDAEIQLHEELMQLGVKSKRRVKIEEIENDDERSCFYCSSTLFFSMISCSCRANLPSKLKQSCRYHFRTLCGCPISKRQFMFRYTYKELVAMDERVYARICKPAIEFGKSI